MIGIYEDSFMDFLKNSLGEEIKISSTNIICKCPWCEYGKVKDHYHCYISLEAPIFHCFHAGCEKSGNIRKFIKKINGVDNSDNFVDTSKIKKSTFSKPPITINKNKKIILPPLREDFFLNKKLYLKKRLKYSNINFNEIKGLIFDIDEFIRLNQIEITPTLFRLKDYLQSNFMGFLTEQESIVILRNIDERAKFKFFKIKIQKSIFLDYYKLLGNDYNSKDIVIAEGIFDIFSAQLFDVLNIKNSIKLYASALSSKYQSLIQSIVFREQIFRPTITILSDRGISINYYKKLKKFNEHIIDKLNIYYNLAGKDFNSRFVKPEKIVL